MSGSTGLRRPDPLVVVVAALLTAAGLVVYLQHRALMALDRQTGVILQKVAEQTAAAAAADIRRLFEAPVFETLTAVNHPELRSGRLDLVTRQYAKGLAEYPQIERFLLWTTDTDREAPREVLFYSRASARRSGAARLGVAAAPTFERDPRLGRALFAMAERYGRSQRIYAAVEHRDGGRVYHVFLRLFWVDATRDRYFAVLGFTVDLGDVRRRLFGELYRTRLKPLFEPADGSPRFDLRVLDEAGRVVFAPPGPAPVIAARADFALQFYPTDDIGSRMAAQVPARVWTLVVSPASRDGSAAFASPATQGYWLSGASVLLMLVALAFALQGQKRATEYARMQADFVSHVSHQLKTPLSVLSVVTETLTLDRARSPEKLARYLAIVRSEAARLSALVEHILQFARLEGGRRPYEVESVDLGVLVRETVKAFSKRPGVDGFTIALEAGDEALTVAADPAALEQVLVNLLDNAVKYSDRDKQITVRLARTAAEAIVEVADRGIGIPPEEVGRIFERFYRGAGARLNRKGFGLGLAIAQEHVRAHRGRLEVESAPGAGSLFRVRLPILHDGARRRWAWRRVRHLGARQVSPAGRPGVGEPRPAARVGVG